MTGSISSEPAVISRPGISVVANRRQGLLRHCFLDYHSECYATGVMDESMQARAADVIEKSRRANVAVAKALEVLLTIERSDPKLMVNLRQRYGLPEALSAVATSFEDAANAMRAFFAILEN
jgi:hypothetical protein